MRALSLLVVLVGCSNPADPEEDAPPGIVTGGVHGHDFPSFDIEAGHESDTFCQQWSLGNAAPVYVNAVHATNGGGIHHSNWYFMDAQYFEGEDGTFECTERDFDQAIAAVLGGVLFAQSTQALEETQQFHEGTAIVLPPDTKIIGNIHMLNATPSALSTHLHLDLHTVLEEEVHTRLAPFSLQYLPLHIPPRSEAHFMVECDLSESHVRDIGRPLDFSFYYVLPHYHELGNLMRLEVVGGDRDGELLYETTATTGEPLGGMIDPPLSLAGARGVRLTCGYDNPRDEEVRWGIGDQEMCIFLAFTDSERIWGGGNNFADGNVVLGEVDGVVMNEGACLFVNVPSAGATR